ncbi:sterile alpha motif domain-containing protein 9-like [Mastacembelus armatus]|uniref:Sterile alpha motif domain containing 9 like n=1 Tax=Mastacembelus armatus TaxID=205130 RepID=A0A3Q3NFP7_9TELE|nr:sterile alpha motif domain-containing protein 9-like [Mastacembelus armatus]
MADEPELLPKNWTESQVSAWLKSIGVKEQYIKKLYEEEVDGQILLALDEDFLKTKISMKSGPAHLIIQKRDELLNNQQKPQEKKKPTKGQKSEVELKNTKQKSDQRPPITSGDSPAQISLRDQDVLEERQTGQGHCMLTSKEDCKPRPFDQEAIDFLYVKHRVLQPESGAFNLISPCHEFKSFVIAADLDRTRLQAKFAKEVLKFAAGCMNIRSNGTIHFGVMDSKEDVGYVHGEIIGIPVKEKDIYVDALDYLERSVSSDKEHMRQCVRPPRFIEVMDRESTEKRYVVEVDIVPSVSIVKTKVYVVRLPNFKESTNKIEFEKETILRRVGSKTEPVSDLSDFYQRVKDRDAQREEAEKNQFLGVPQVCQDLGRKLKMLMTSGKKFIEKEKWFILITNRFTHDDLYSIDWLLNMSLFCVFDFDPDSKISGLCSRYLQHRAANMHSLQSYRISSDTSIKEFTSNLHLFEQTSWIFCNGCSDFKGSETPCDEMTWIQTKMTLLRESVSLICKQILPKGAFQVIFLLTSPVEKPILHTFYEFFTDMEGHEDIICICESQKNFQKWQSFAEGSCRTEIVNNFSVVGMKMSHVNATLQQLQPIKVCSKKHLPVVVKGTCLLETHKEECMCSLEILTVDHCDETSEDFIKEEKTNIDHQFYRGGRVTWLNFWLAEHVAENVGDIIERDAYHDVSKLLNDALKRNAEQTPVNCINIYHHPGSGGSTVARQVLWNNRKDLRCAVVKPSYSATIVAQHAVELREYEEKDPQNCVPVLLLIEDSEKEYLDDLKNELEVAINVKKIQYETLCFILLSCRRSYDPERRCKESALQNVAVTHKLSPEEKRKFARKRKVLEEQYEPQFILTFVLMSEEFTEEYVQQFVEHLLQDIDHQSVVTRLICYVALLNTYIQNSFISQSHCEALLALKIRLEKFRHHEFERSLSDQAKLVFLHLRDDKTHIESIEIIHPLVAKEILQQLLGPKTQSSLAMDLLRENVLFEHRYGREEYLSFLRALFIRRSRISKGDEYDSFFSPLIEHVCEDEKSPDKAIELLKEAFSRFHDDPFFAQQLARLHYTYEKFEEAEHWAETAARQKPKNSYILDTKGQVYRKWFQAKCKAIENVPKTAQNTADAVETALRALKCFQESEKAADEEMENVNSSGYFAEVEVGCSLLKLISSLQVFANKTNGHAECMKYLVTDYIPVDIEEAWEPFHGRLKKLHKTMQDALEWISEDLGFFQTDISADEDETHESPEEKISHPLKWLAKKSSEYGKYFSEPDQTKCLQNSQSIPANLTPFQKRMLICELGGGNMISVLSKLTDQKDAVHLLECILSLYPDTPIKARFVQRDIVNYITAHITLNCLSPQNQKVAPLKDLQALCHQFPSDKRKCLPNALFLLTLLFWPEEYDTDHEKETKYEIVQSAVEHLDKSYWTKIKEIPQRKRRLYTHFFLGSGNGLDKIVHKKKFESVTKLFSVSEKRMKWFRGEAWKKPEIAKMLKSVSGWTENGVVYLEGPQKKKFSILPLHVPSVPHSNENITFYLGFTFRGPVACNIIVKK